MNKCTRRTFGKHLFAASLLPIASAPLSGLQVGDPEHGPGIPDTIAGYMLSPEDKQLASKFLSTHEKNLSALRAKDLPNNLAPCFSFKSPQPSSEKKTSR